MGKNLIPVIAKALGVENGEEFEIKGITSSKYRVKNDKLEVNFWDDKWEPSTLSISLFEDIEIIKLPFEPKAGEDYWTYTSYWEIYSETWCNTFYDYSNLKVGGCFRTKEEAINTRPQKYKELTGKEWGCDDG